MIRSQIFGGDQVATTPSTIPDVLPWRPYQVLVSVSGDADTESVSIPTGTVMFEIRNRTGTMRWGLEDLSGGGDPYDTLASGEVYSLPDILNFEANLPSTLHFYGDGGAATVLISFS